jgi:hypothetical protein
MLTQARAQQFYLSFITSSDPAREGMREVFAEEDTRLPPLERARLGANGTVFASPEVTGLYESLFAEAWPVELNPGRFRSDEARLEVLGRTAGILLDLEAAICRELGAESLAVTRRSGQCNNRSPWAGPAAPRRRPRDVPPGHRAAGLTAAIMAQLVLKVDRCPHQRDRLPGR